MKKLVLAFIFIVSTFQVKASECEQKVIEYHTTQYEQSYQKTQEAIFPYFILRENILFHTFAYPEIAFKEVANKDENYIAAKMIKRAAKKNKTAEDLIEAYRTALSTGELCDKLQEKYKRPRKIRSFLFKKLNI